MARKLFLAWVVATFVLMLGHAYRAYALAITGRDSDADVTMSFVWFVSFAVGVVIAVATVDRDY